MSPFVKTNDVTQKWEDEPKWLKEKQNMML
jgi:hypothetical protein